MRIVMFYHSLVSDWNHGNAHFLRGIATELLVRGHEVLIYEQKDAWSFRNLTELHGDMAISDFHRAYPHLQSVRYDRATLNLERVLHGADLVLVHEWNDPELVARIGRHRRQRGDFVLLFHDTHHRAVTAPEEISQFDLSAYDGVLAFGNAVSKAYRTNGWAERVWTWHEAADTRVFRADARQTDPRSTEFDGDLVWIGNWGDEERSEELREFLLRPVKELRLRARVYGVRYPQHALDELAAANIEYGGWLPNYEVPGVFSKFKLTIHVARRPYVQALPGIPTIRMFEALACGIPLVSAYWPDAEHLFTPGLDYLVARDGNEMGEHLTMLLKEPERAQRLADHGWETIRARHTCAYRVDELLAIHSQLSHTRHKAVA